MLGKSYIDVLERFDRKERGWLMRECVGGRSALSARFCSALGRSFGDPDPASDAWWTIDYHLDWLAGASRWPGEASNEVYRGGGVTCSIEDVDLIVATPAQLFLIEAKAAGSWGNEQLRSKVARLDQICPGGRLHIRSTGQTVTVRFGILSIRQAVRVNTEGWPPWALKDGRPFVVEPEVATPWAKLAVQRANSPTEGELEWRIVQTGT